MKASAVQNSQMAYYHAYRYSLQYDANFGKRRLKMNGAKRVVIFCLLTAVLPTILIIIPLHLRHNVFTDVTYEVAESDVLEIGDDISNIFCQDHIIKMNTSFSAYQVDRKPEISNIRKHIRLKKSMRLPDDTLEYWGFFLPKGSTVRLSVCSRYEGSSILVVHGEKNLRTCGLLDHSQNKGMSTTTVKTPAGKSAVRVRFEFDAEEKSTNQTSRQKRTIDDENNAKESEDDDDVGEESDGLRTFRLVRNIARDFVAKRQLLEKPRTFEESVLGHKLRHARNHAEREENALREAEGYGEELDRFRRKRLSEPGLAHNLDAKMVHGGNAQNKVDSADSSEASSFENALLTCYGGDILLTQEFPPSHLCNNVSYLLANHTARMTTIHNVTEDGYYYYIFYSDNDLVENDIHAVFDIYKPTYQMANITKRCINESTCTFPLAITAKEVVIVEVPMRDGIENEEEDMSQLISVCQPRMAIYIIFPLLVLILILGCAFL